MKNFLITLLMLPLMAQASELKLLSWNLFMLPKPLNFSLQQTRAKMMAEFLPHSGHDIYLFQETFAGMTKKKLSKAFKKSHPYEARLESDKKFPHLLDSGLMVFSRYPFKVIGKDYFKKCTNTDCFAAKGVLLIEVSMPGNKKIQIATTHLQAWENQKAIDIRRSQIEQIKTLLEKNSRPEVPQLLVGDLNIDGFVPDEYPGSLSLLNMTSEPLNGDQPATNGYIIDCYKKPGKDNTPQWLDHVWIKPNQSKATVLYRHALDYQGIFKKKKVCPLSDHRAVEAKISL
jgi:endonuclease/exonuclease/phosphatase family metal-dependent hydrolase